MYNDNIFKQSIGADSRLSRLYYCKFIFWQGHEHRCILSNQTPNEILIYCMACKFYLLITRVLIHVHKVSYECKKIWIIALLMGSGASFVIWFSFLGLPIYNFIMSVTFTIFIHWGEGRGLVQMANKGLRDMLTLPQPNLGQNRIIRSLSILMF